MSDWLMDGLVRWLAEQVTGLLGALLTFLVSSLFTSPDVTVLPQVKSIAEHSSLIVDACFIVAIIAVGIAIMAGDSIQMRYGLKELIPRLVAGFVLSAFAVPLTSVLIEFASSLTVAVAGADAPTAETVAFVQARLATAMTDPSAALMMTIVGLTIVVLMFMLLGTWLGRIAVLLILAGVAPVALACYATPWTQAAADLWWRAMLGTLAPPAVQAVAFSQGIDLLITPDSNLPILLGLPGGDGLNLMLVIIVLWVTLRIPAMMHRFTQQRGNHGIGAIVLRAVFIQGITRRLPLVGRR